MKKILTALLMTAAFAGFLGGCATASDPSDAYPGQSPHQIFVDGKKALEDKSYSDAIKHFEALDVQYPFGEETETAQLYLIYSYYMKEDYALSVATADRFIRMHPTNPNVDYAYFMRGVSDYYQNLGIMERIFTIDLATRDLTQIQKSFTDFNELVVRFPNSRYAPPAYQYMIYLRNVLADHQLHIAEYYYNRRAYIAAADRASDLIARYQGAPTTVDGLVLLVKAYHQLGARKLEDDALTVLHYNYPDVKVDYNSDYSVINN